MGKDIDISELKKLKNNVKNHFQSIKTGEQSLLDDTIKLFKPVTDASNQSTQKLLANQQQLTNTLIPLANNLERRIDQVEALQSLPFHSIPGIEDIQQSTPTRDIYNVNLDKRLNVTDEENLEDMRFDLPSVVQAKGSYNEVLEAIKSKNHQIGQFVGKKSKKTENEQTVYRSQQKTLEKYKNTIIDIQRTRDFATKAGEGLKQKKLVKQKRGRGRPKSKPDAIMYTTTEDLVSKLQEFTQAYYAGNNGVYNHIVSILDELLNIRAIDKSLHDELFKNIFKAISK